MHPGYFPPPVSDEYAPVVHNLDARPQLLRPDTLARGGQFAPYAQPAQFPAQFAYYQQSPPLLPPPPQAAVYYLEPDERDALREQLFVMERDFRFQGERVLKAQQDQIDVREAEIDALRNDNYILELRNAAIANEIDAWSQLLADKLKDTSKRDHPVQQQMAQTAQVLRQERLQNKKKKTDSEEGAQVGPQSVGNPVIDELKRELEHLKKENQDLFERKTLLERQIYKDDLRKEVTRTAFALGQLAPDGSELPAWSERFKLMDHSYSSLVSNESRNQLARDKCKALADVTLKQFYTPASRAFNESVQAPTRDTKAGGDRDAKIPVKGRAQDDFADDRDYEATEKK